MIYNPLTVIYVALSVPTAIIFSFFIAMLLNTNVKGKGFFRTIFYLCKEVRKYTSGS